MTEVEYCALALDEIQERCHNIPYYSYVIPFYQSSPRTRPPSHRLIRTGSRPTYHALIVMNHFAFGCYIVNLKVEYISMKIEGRERKTNIIFLICVDAMIRLTSRYQVFNCMSVLQVFMCTDAVALSV